MIIERHESVPSTQEYIKKFIKNREDAIVYADMQTAGMGTKGRSFISEKGGLYVSKLTFYKNLRAENSWSIMVDTAVAVVKTLMAFNINAQIKWPNDIWVNNKKICGILTQNGIVGEFVDYSIVGIGINVNNDIANDIKEIATSVKKILGKEVDLQSFFLSLTLNLSSGTTIEQYKSFSLVLGKKITVSRNGQIFESVVQDILPNGALQLDNGERLYAGEILKITLSQN